MQSMADVQLECSLLGEPGRTEGQDVAGVLGAPSALAQKFQMPNIGAPLYQQGAIDISYSPDTGLHHSSAGV